MESKRYCPSCGSFNIRRIKRTLLQKHLLKHSPKYRCVHCFIITSRKILEKNPLAPQPGLHNNTVKTTATIEKTYKDCA